MMTPFSVTGFDDCHQHHCRRQKWPIRKPNLAESTFGAKNENCDSLEAAEKCEIDCETINLECLVTCDSDTSCLSQCSREFLTCVDNCPCFTNCYEVNYGLSDIEYDCPYR